MDRIKKLTEELNDSSLEVRIQAAGKLGELGATDEDAKYALVNRFLIAEDPVELNALNHVFEEMDPVVMSRAHYRRNLEKNIESGRSYARTLTVTQAREVVKSLLWLYVDKPSEDYEWSDREWQLIAIGQEVPEIIPDLLKEFESNENLRAIIGDMLVHVGYEREEVGEGLVPLLRHEDPAVVDAAADLLRSVKVGGSVSEAVNTLLELYERSDGEWAPGEKALVAMGSGERHPEVILAFLEILRTRPDSSYPWSTSRLLGWMVRDGGERVVSTVLDLLHHQMPVVRMTALGACPSNRVK